MKKIINKIKNNKANGFDLQELIRFFAQNTLTLGEEVMIKEYIRKGAKQLNIDARDLQGVYNSYKRIKNEN